MGMAHWGLDWIETSQGKGSSQGFRPSQLSRPWRHPCMPRYVASSTPGPSLLGLGLFDSCVGGGGLLTAPVSLVSWCGRRISLEGAPAGTVQRPRFSLP